MGESKGTSAGGPRGGEGRGRPSARSGRAQRRTPGRFGRLAEIGGARAVKRSRSYRGGVPTFARALGGVRLACCLGLVGLVAACPLFTGAQSQLAWSVMGIAALGLAAVLLATTLRRPRRLPAPWLLVALGLLGVLLLVQLMPLPASVVGALSPRRAELGREADAALGREPSGSYALTLSTKTTRDALCLLAVYGFAFVASGVAFRRPSRVRLLFAALAVSGACMALWGVWCVLFGPGLPLTSTYVNRNRLAALLVMDLFAATGWAMLTLPHGSSRERAAALSCAGAIALGIVMTLSRLALASVAMSLLLLAFLALKGRLRGAPGIDGDGRRGRRVLVVGSSITVSAILASLLTSVDPVLERYSLLFEEGVQRLTCWRVSLGIVRDFPLTGSGAGSFRHVFRLYQRAGELTGFWKYAHSDPLNTLTDLGPAGLALVLAAALFWYRSAWRGLGTASTFRKTVAWIGVGAVSAVLVHSLGDFVLKQPANALVFSVLAGSVAGAVGSRSPRPLPRWLPAALALVALVFAALLVPAARAGYWKHRADSEEEPARRAQAFQSVLDHDWRDGEARLGAARSLAASVPRGEPGAAREGAGDVLAMLRGAPPGETIDPRALYLAGGMLWHAGETAGADRAVRTSAEFASAYDDVTFRAGVYFFRRWIETRGALRLDGGSALDLSVEYLRRACLVSPGRLAQAFDLLSAAPRSAARLEDIIPPDPASRYAAAHYLWRAGRLAEARRVLEAALLEAGEPERAGRHPDLGARILGRLAGLRDEMGDYEGALEARLGHVRKMPVDSRPGVASAHVDKLLRRKRAADAALFVRALRRRYPDGPAGLYAEARYAAASGDHVLAYRSLSRYVEHSVDAEGYHRLAEAARRLSRTAEAETYAGRAIELRPRERRYILARAGMREAAGNTAGAALDLRAALDLKPANVHVRRRLASLYVRDGRPLQAAEVWKDAVSRSPRDASAHVGLAQAYHAAGLHEDAAEHARRALELDPGRADARRLLRAMSLEEDE